MARGKKKEKELTIEERLEQALVPVEEQPYSVPENWCWVYSPCIFDIEYGKGLSTKELKEDGYPVFGANGQIGFYSSYMFEKPQAIMSCRGAYSGTMNRSLPYSYVTSNSLIMKSKIQNVHMEYIYYLFSALNITSLISGTAQPQVTVQAFEKYPVPLIPLKEQQRIVDRIESLFAKLDEAKEKVQAVVDGFGSRKAAILHKAFMGELTAHWREKTNFGIDTWEIKPLKCVCKYMKAGGDKPQDFSDNKDKEHQIPVVANGVSDDGIIGYTGISKEDGGSVTVSGRGTIGFSIYRDYPYYPVVRLIVLAPEQCIRGPYLKYYFDAFPVEGTGSSIPQLTIPMIKEKSVLLPTLDEQDEIIRTIDLFIQKEQQTKEAAEAVLDQIENMKKSILARAFRGELGTNDPSEENAVELLKQVL